MDTMFIPATKEDFLQSVDRGLAQLDAGLGKDAFESFDSITSELETGYNAMKVAQNNRNKKAGAAS